MMGRNETRVLSLLAALMLVVGITSGPVLADELVTLDANDQAGQCDGFNTSAKIDVDDFVDGIGTWYNVPGDDGNFYTVTGTLSADGKSITFEVLNVTDATVDFCLKGGSSSQEGPQYFESETEGSLVREISNVVIYRVYIPPVEQPTGQWCSPGFWRNSPIQAEAAAANADLSFLPSGVTYVDVLNNPQIYGGTLFNLVGDALSAAAGLEWGDVRPEDTCPFSADASNKPRPPRAQPSR